MRKHHPPFTPSRRMIESETVVLSHKARGLSNSIAIIHYHKAKRNQLISEVAGRSSVRAMIVEKVVGLSRSIKRSSDTQGSSRERDRVCWGLKILMLLNAEIRPKNKFEDERYAYRQAQPAMKTRDETLNRERSQSRPRPRRRWRRRRQSPRKHTPRP